MPEVSEARRVMADAVALHEQGKFHDAIAHYIRAVHLDDRDPEVLHAAGIALGQANKNAEAVRLLSGALEFGKNVPAVWEDLGMAFLGMRKDGQPMLGNAERCFYNAVKRDPKRVTGWVHFGTMAYASGNAELGEQRFSRALAIGTRSVGDKFAQSLVWLIRGQYRTGWKWYECRKAVGNWLMRNRQQSEQKPKALNRQDVKRGMRIMVEAEQGQGDAVMVARFLQPFADQFGVTVVLQSHNALVDLLRGALPNIEVVGRDVIPEADGWIPMLSLPYFVGLESPKHLPSPILPFGTSYLKRHRHIDYAYADGQRIETYRFGKGPRKERVFLHVRGNAAHTYDFDRSMPSNDTARALTEHPSVEIVTAAYRPTGHGENGEVLYDEPTWRETVNTLSTCDRVVTVDTGLAHVAASMGIPTDILVPTIPEWRWGFGQTTPWYPSARLIRRTRWDAWSEAITQTLPGANVVR